MVNITTRPASGTVEFDGSIGAAPTPAASTIGYIWASGTSNVGLYYTDGAGTPVTTQLNAAAGGGGTIGGTVSAGYLPYASTTTDTLANFVVAKAEDSSIYIGTSPSSTSTAQYNMGFGGNTLGSLTTGDYNVGMGRSVLSSLTDGQRNVAIGYTSQNNSTTGDYNTAVGMETMFENTGSNYNTAIGYGAIQYQTGSASHGGTAVGAFSLQYSEGIYNTAIGYKAMMGSTTTRTAHSNTAVGNEAMQGITSATYNTAVGYQAGYAVTTGVNNVMVGQFAGGNVTTGADNILIGRHAGGNTRTTQNKGIMIGSYAGQASTSVSALYMGHNAGYYSSGEYNIYLGYQAGSGDSTTTSSEKNIGVGKGALLVISSGDKNIAIGHEVATSLTTASNNIFIGLEAGSATTTNSYNVAIGSYALSAADGAGSSTALGYGAMRYSTADNSTGIGQYALSGAMGDKNVALGNSAGGIAKAASNSIMVGYEAGYHPTGASSVYIGYKAGYGVLDSGAQKNVAIGSEALMNVTTGANIVAIGYLAGYAQTTDDEGSIYIGQAAGQSDYGTNRSLFIGFDAGNNNTTGGNNLAIGHKALEDNVTGIHNVVIGREAGKENTGNQNVALGTFALKSSVAHYYNTAIGDAAMQGSTSGDRNVAVGTSAMMNDSAGTGGSNNVAIGFGTLRQNSDSGQVAVGSNSMNVNTTGEGNTAVGYNTLIGNTIGNYNTALGYDALYTNVHGDQNTAVGYRAMRQLAPADGEGENTAMGHHAAYYLTTGKRNVYIGADAGRSATYGDNNLGIGYRALENRDNVADALYTFSGSPNTDVSRVEGTYSDVAPNATDGGGTGQKLNIVVDGDGVTTFTLLSGGTNVDVGDTFTFIASQMGGAGASVVLTATALGLDGENNIAIGNQCMVYTSGSLHSNIGIGVGALNGTDFRGDANTVVGKSAGAKTTTGYQNVYMGYYAGASGTTARHNVVIGNQAGQEITSTRQSVVIGASAGRYLENGRFNVLLGTSAGAMITDGESNVMLGSWAGAEGDKGDGSIGIGYGACYYPEGTYNTFIGYNAGYGVDGTRTANANIGIGRESLLSITAGVQNTAIGNYTGYTNTVGNYNTALGHVALYRNVHGDQNTAIGHQALYNTAPADGAGNNVALGHAAGFANTTGVGNVFIGYEAGADATASNKLYISNATGTPLIGGSFGDGTLTITASGNTPYSTVIKSDPTAGTDGLAIDAYETRLSFIKRRDSVETWSITAGNDVSSLQFHKDSNAKTCIMGGSAQVLGTMFGSSVEPAIRGVCIASGASYISLDNTSANTIYRTAGKLQIDTTEKVYIDGNLEVNGATTISGAFLVEPSNPTNIITKAAKTDVSGDYTITTSYSHYKVESVAGDVPGDVNVRITTAASPTVGDEYWIVGSTYHGPGPQTGAATIDIIANTGQTINKVGSSIELAETASTGTETTANFRLGHLLCIDTNTWALFISDYGPTS